MWLGDRRTAIRLQIWWLLCTLVLVSLPYTVWEYKEAGYTSEYAGLCTTPLLGRLPEPVQTVPLLFTTAFNRAVKRPRPRIGCPGSHTD